MPEPHTPNVTDAFFDLIASLVTGLHDTLPEWTIDMSTMGGDATANIYTMNGESVTTGGSTFQAGLFYMSLTNNFIPLDQGILCVGFSLSVVIVLYAWKILKWAIGVVRGSGTS